jgi:ABC-type amino acid transport system permease subunit
MKNLPQFRNKSYEEVRWHILEKKGVNIEGNFNSNNTMMWILIGLVAVARGIEIAKWWQQRQMKNEIGET